MRFQKLICGLPQCLKACKDKKIPYVDYLIYRKGYVLSKEDQNFIECLKNVIEQVK